MIQEREHLINELHGLVLFSFIHLLFISTWIKNDRPSIETITFNLQIAIIIEAVIMVVMFVRRIYLYYWTPPSVPPLGAMTITDSSV